jgi:asparagine synthase (glutamine-hydrolysing)
MCGIAGILTSSPSQDDLKRQVLRMLELQRHRGPDDMGVWGNAKVALGNCRLSILDLTDAGHQPMTNTDESIWVVQNGEIYNFEELRDELIRAGYVFRSNCDSEVLVHGYDYWGPDLLRHLRGMFALALWSETEQRLFLGRDRFGIKPLYYHAERYCGGLRMIFASEIKPILAVQRAAVQPNKAIIFDFLRYGLLEHTNETFFEGVQKVPPACYMVIDKDGEMQLRQYWDFEVNPEFGRDSPKEDQDMAEAFKDVFLDSVSHHLVSDVPVGSCLSGGLDSSAIVCAVNNLLRAGKARMPVTDRQRTFTSSFEDPRFDERRYAYEVIEATQAQAHFTFPKAAGFIAELPELLYHQEEPFAGASIYAQWCLMRDIHRSDLKVVLDGQGGDEQLLGYGKFYFFFLKELARQHRYGLLLREGLGVGLSPEFWCSLDFRHGLRYMRPLANLSRETTLVGQSLVAQFAERRPPVEKKVSLAEFIKQDITKYSLPVLLRYEDKNSMAFSVESRVPFVDHVVTEHVAALPINQKLRSGWTKFILRQGLRGLLPEPIRKRKSKLGFVTPEPVWFRAELGQEVERTFAKAHFLREWANLPHLQEAFAKYQKRPGLLSNWTFFRFFIVEKWARQFFLDLEAKETIRRDGIDNSKP